MGEGQVRAIPFEMRREFRQLAVEGQPVRGAIPIPFETMAMAPTRQPLKELVADQQLGPAIEVASAVGLREPLNELPIFAREQFLLVGRARGELDDFTERPALFARTRAEHNKLNSQAVQIGLIWQRP